MVVIRKMLRFVLSLAVFLSFYCCMVHADEDDFDPCKAGESKCIRNFFKLDVILSHRVPMNVFFLVLDAFPF